MKYGESLQVLDHRRSIYLHLEFFTILLDVLVSAIRQRWIFNIMIFHTNKYTQGDGAILVKLDLIEKYHRL